MENVNIYNLIILDESGSMQSIRREALSGLNETIQTIRSAQCANEGQRHFVTIVVFEGDGPKGVRTLCDRMPVDGVKEFTAEDYVPSGCTPLYDAMGLSINHLSKVTLNDDAVLVTIITDGMENASREYSGRDIKDLVSAQREKGWTFAYIGANQDAVEVARELNIRNAMNFDATPEGTHKMMDKLSRATDTYFSMITPCRMVSDSSNFFGNSSKSGRGRRK